MAKVRSVNPSDPPRHLAGEGKKHKGVPHIGSDAQWLENEHERKREQSLPAKYPRQIYVQRPDQAPYPCGIQQRKLGLGDVSEYDPPHLMGEHQTPRTQERHQRLGVDDRGIFHARVR